MTTRDKEEPLPTSQLAAELAILQQANTYLWAWIKQLKAKKPVEVNP